jgi:hypothetical protein
MIAIIGGGFAGIYSLKYCIQEGLSCKLFETSDDIGGVWKYSKDTPGGVLENTFTSSSLHFLHPTDFPFPKNTSEFPHHSIVLKHLKNYCKHFNLYKHIQFNTKIERIVKDGKRWLLSFNNTQEEFDKIIVCTGIHQSPSPIPKIFKRFRNRENVIHSHYYEQNKEKFIGKRVLVIGGGETANDIANELAPICGKLYMSIRNGQWFQGKWVGANEPADLYLNKYMTSIWNPVFRDWVGFINQYLWGKGGTGVKEWKPTVPYNHSFFTKGRECVDWISKGKLTPCSKVTHIKDDLIFFKDKNISVDYIILCTGYNNKHLDSMFVNKEHLADRFKLIFHPDDHSLSFCGFVRPTLGSLPMLAELQARYISRVFSQKKFIPSNIHETIATDKEFHDESFPNQKKRLSYLVYYYIYCDQIAKLIGCKPNLFKTFFQDPKLWVKLFLNPWSPFHYTIHSDNERTKAISEHMLNELHISRSASKLRLAAIVATLFAIVLVLSLVVPSSLFFLLPVISFFVFIYCINQ